MSEHDGGDSGKLGAFLLGFLVGVLVCLGAGGTLFVVQGRQVALERMRAEDMARMAEMEAVRAREMAEREREAALRALKEAKEAKEKEAKGKDAKGEKQDP